MARYASPPKGFKTWFEIWILIIEYVEFIPDSVSFESQSTKEKVKLNKDDIIKNALLELTKKLPTAEDMELLKRHFSYQNLNQEGKRIEELFTSLPTK